jgi:AraC-like DNA-binding protein
VNERHQIRADWLSDVVNGCHNVVDHSSPPDLSSLANRLQEFVQSLPRAKGPSEKLVLRGLLLEVYVHIDAWVARFGIDDTVREQGRRCWLNNGRSSRPEVTFQHACAPLVEGLRSHSQHPIHEQAHRWIAANWAQPLSVVRLARDLHVHPRTLRRCFRKHLGISVHRHWRVVRAREAVRLLQETTLKIEAIALLVGCRHRSTFYQMVTTITGKTPTQIRQEQK